MELRRSPTRAAVAAEGLQFRHETALVRADLAQLRTDIEQVSEELAEFSALLMEGHP